MPTTTQRLAEASDADAGRAARKALLAALRERVALLQELDAGLAALIEQAVLRITAQLAAAPTDYQLWVLPRLLEGIRRVADELAAQAGALAAGGIRRAWEGGEKAVEAPVAAAQAAAQAVAPTAPALVSAPPLAPAQPAAALGQPAMRQVQAMQHFTTGLIKGATDDLVKRINTELGQVVLGVQTPQQAMQRVAKLLPDRSGTQVRAIVTHQLAQAFNTASFQSLVRQAERDPAIRKQWRRSGKIHSRANHDAADGQVQEVKLPFTLLPGDGRGEVVKIMYPCEPGAPLKETINCGCVCLPWKASWKMKAPAARPLTDQERQRRDAPRKRPPAKKAPAQTTQQRALGAFPTGRATDPTGQPLVVDARLFPAAMADPRLVKGRQDLAAYWAVQGIRRPTEVWQAERIDLDTGEVLRTRRYVKRFEAGGQTWLGWAELQYSAAEAAWVPTRAWTATPAAGQLEQLLGQVRAGVRVWPRRR